MNVPVRKAPPNPKKNNHEGDLTTFQGHDIFLFPTFGTNLVYTTFYVKPRENTCKQPHHASQVSFSRGPCLPPRCRGGLLAWSPPPEPREQGLEMGQDGRGLRASPEAFQAGDLNESDRLLASVQR